MKKLGKNILIIVVLAFLSVIVILNLIIRENISKISAPAPANIKTEVVKPTKPPAQDSTVFVPEPAKAQKEMPAKPTPQPKEDENSEDSLGYMGDQPLLQ